MKYPTKSNNERPGLEYDTFKNILNNAVISTELLNMIFGKFMGEGSSRIVFEYLPDPKYVIKIEKGDWHANVTEHLIWQSVIGTKWEKWFAPVKSITPNGSILIQRKCQPLLEAPKQLPNFFDDLRMENLGMHKGQVVAIDYAMNKILEIGVKNGKLINAKNLWND